MTNHGRLYIVSTPIGNLQDISARARQILSTVSVVAAEDTRRTRKLLSALGIGKQLISYRGQVREKASGRIIEEMEAGNDVALVTDAGTPGISDPGYFLVREASKRGISVIPVPGPSALAAAISASGMAFDRFIFAGFLPTRSPARSKRLEEMALTGYPLALYESPKRIIGTLVDIVSTMGDRTVVLGREITKVHEEFLRGTASEVLTALDDREVKGEITLLVEGGTVKCAPPELGRAVVEMRMAGLSASRTASILSAVTGEPKRKIYQLAINSKSSKGDDDNG